MVGDNLNSHIFFGIFSVFDSAKFACLVDYRAEEVRLEVIGNSLNDR